MRPRSFQVSNSGTSASIGWPNLAELAGISGISWHRLDAGAVQVLSRRDQDFGGCRCQAFLLTGDAHAADPVCHLSPHHAVVAELAADRKDAAYSYRTS